MNQSVDDRGKGDSRFASFQKRRLPSPTQSIRNLLIESNIGRSRLRRVAQAFQPAVTKVSRPARRSEPRRPACYLSPDPNRFECGAAVGVRGARESGCGKLNDSPAQGRHSSCFDAMIGGQPAKWLMTQLNAIFTNVGAQRQPPDKTCVTKSDNSANNSANIS